MSHWGTARQLVDCLFFRILSPFVALVMLLLCFADVI